MMRVRVIGGGISGLLTAYFLVKEGCEVEIYEVDSEVGGKLKTLRQKHGLVETAANAVLANQLVETVAQEIGLQLIEKKTEARKRFILKNNRPTRWPIGWRSTLRLIGFVLRLKLNLFFASPKSHETLQQWSHRSLGEETTRFLVDPACQGIFGVTSEDLSAVLIFDYFFGKTKSPKGILRGSIAPLGGMGEWSAALKKFLEGQGVRFHLTQDGAESLQRDRHSTATVLATDIQAASRILKTIGDPRGELLSRVPMVDLVSVTAFFQQKLHEGFGVLFPRGDVEPLGVLLNSSIFRERVVREETSETWIFGGKTPSRSMEMPDSALLKALQEVRRDIWKNHESPLDYKVSRWEKALPLYGVELERVLESLEIERDNVYLMGNYLSEIGLNRIFSKAKAIATLVAGKKV
ncbi:MAG: FAD-dependent oxidoreductase [Bdellovibrionales bacterium]|nr:FAD-dependent oxidoreductase [Bdellovibrionales bacterium]